MGSELPRRGYLGMDLEPAGPATAGLAVAEVAVDSPAASAGLRPGDLLVSIAQVDELTLDGVRDLVPRLAVGQHCDLEVRRAGEKLLLSLEVAPMPLEALADGRVELSHVAWGAHRLRSIWSWPQSPATAPGPHPVVWLIPGLTWLSDEFPLQPGHPTFKIVEGLTRAGFATLRVERSGLGDSEGPSCTELDLEAELDAFAAGLAHLRAHPDADPDRLFMFGRSLGGVLAPMVASGQGLRGVAVWGTWADDWLQASLSSSARQFALAGMDMPTLEIEIAELDQLLHLLYVERLTPEQAHARAPRLQHVQPENFFGSRIHGRHAAYFHQLQQADIAGAWAAVDCPVLAMYGDCDERTSEQDLQRVGQLAGPGAELAVLPGVDHHMHDRGSLEDVLKRPWGGKFSPRALARLVDFLDAHR